jgi:hypothetical protein
VIDRDVVGLLFIITWIALAAIGFALFQFSRDARRKRRLFPWGIGLSSALFIGFMNALGAPWFVVLGMTPFVLLIAWLNLRMTRFCDSCGRTVIGGFGGRPRYCQHCGASLE